jgi:flagellar capping protein FliD
MASNDEMFERQINEKIEELRVKMIQAANENGMNHPSVIDYSKQLDECMNQLLRKKMSC